MSFSSCKGFENSSTYYIVEPNEVPIFSSNPEEFQFYVVKEQQKPFPLVFTKTLHPLPYHCAFYPGEALFYLVFKIDPAWPLQLHKRLPCCLVAFANGFPTKFEGSLQLRKLVPCWEQTWWGIGYPSKQSWLLERLVEKGLWARHLVAATL